MGVVLRCPVVSEICESHTYKQSLHTEEEVNMFASIPCRYHYSLTLQMLL